MEMQNHRSDTNKPRPPLLGEGGGFQRKTTDATDDEYWAQIHIIIPGYRFYKEENTV